jgi:hypothetical protein
MRHTGFWGIVIAHTLYRFLYQTHFVIRRIIYHTLQQEFLVGRLEFGEVTLDPVELWTVRHIEDLGDVQVLKQMLRVLGLMHTQVVQEQCKVTTTEYLSDLIDECNKDLGVDRFIMHDIVDEAMLFTDCGNHS